MQEVRPAAPFARCAIVLIERLPQPAKTKDSAAVLYIESASTDPYYNLALEQHAFDGIAGKHGVFMLWRNDKAIIVGKHQNTTAEINAGYVRQKGIRVVRRLSGGGAVYHDLGNVNFTWITTSAAAGDFDFAAFCNPVVRALGELGVTAEVNGRNDMTIHGRKFSGNAQYRKRGRIMHHGTILYDSDLEAVGQALVVPRDKIESKGLKSVRSRVTNVKPFMRDPVPVERFMEVLREAVFRDLGLRAHGLTAQDEDAVQRLRHEVYETWDWNYGRSPAYTIIREKRVPGVGTISAHIDVQRGKIADIAFYGDYFGNADGRDLGRVLIGARLEVPDLLHALKGVVLEEYFHNLEQETFIGILTQ